jgi:hypothetical protein
MGPISPSARPGRFLIGGNVSDFITSRIIPAYPLPQPPMGAVMPNYFFNAIAVLVLLVFIHSFQQLRDGVPTFISTENSR